MTATDLLVAAHRSDLAELNRLARRDLELIVAPYTTPPATLAVLRLALPDLVAVYGAAAATLAADLYDDLRDTAEISGRFRAAAAGLPQVSRTEALAAWATSTPATGDLFAPAALARAAGGLQRIVAGASRDTITAASVADPRASGWQRTGSSGSCGFCSMLISRGAVYTTRSARFAAHDHCDCTATPAFGGRPVPVEPYTPSSRRVTSADRARVAAWLARQ